MSKENFLNEIMSEIIGLDTSKLEEERKKQIHRFIDSTVNGDDIQAHLTISANLDETKKGIIVYILTNARFIKVDIDIHAEEISSSIFPLDTITGIERKLLEGGKAQVKIAFPNNSFGLIYRANNEAITKFFQKVDMTRAEG
jgi:hypothetical protein